MSDTPRTGLKAGWILADDKRLQRGAWAPGGYACRCVKCSCSYSGDKRSTMCAECAYAAPEENTASVSEFGGTEPLGIDYFKAQLESARERIKQLEKPITGETSDGYHTFSELYEHRHALFIVLQGHRESWMSKKHHDGSEMDGWFIAGLELPTGTITYHLPMRLWDTCVKNGAEVMENAPEWDGHTSKDVVNRLMRYAEMEYATS